MSTGITTGPPASPPPGPALDTWPELARWSRLAFLVGGVALAVSVGGGAFVAPTYFFRSWLVAFTAFVGVALGSMVLVLLQYLTGGTWGYVLRRPLEAATRTLPLLAVLAVPLALGLPRVYPWADPNSPLAHSPNLENTRPYLNPTAFLVRLVVYFAVWNALSYVLNRWSRQLDQTRDPALLERCQKLGAAGIMLYVVTITFAAIDWAMSLEFPWFSTIYGAMLGMGQVLSGFAVGVFVLCLLSTRPPLDAATDGQSRRDLGSLMLAFVMIWAYLAFSQFLLIWSGNLPEEVPWYVARLTGGWQYAALALLLLHFALPFVLLLSTDVKRDRRTLAAVALLVFAMRIVDLFWLIVASPTLRYHAEGEPAAGGVLYATTLIGIGGVWVGYYLWQLGSWPLLPALPPEPEGQPHGAAAHH